MTGSIHLLFHQKSMSYNEVVCSTLPRYKVYRDVVFHFNENFILTNSDKFVIRATYSKIRIDWQFLNKIPQNLTCQSKLWFNRSRISCTLKVWHLILMGVLLADFLIFKFAERFLKFRCGFSYIVFCFIFYKLINMKLYSTRHTGTKSGCFIK